MYLFFRHLHLRTPVNLHHLCLLTTKDIITTTITMDKAMTTVISNPLVIAV